MCQYWLSETTVTSPYFNDDDGSYAHNLNCTWMINAQVGFYIHLKITFFRVNSSKDFKKVAMIFLKLILVTVE